MMTDIAQPARSARLRRLAAYIESCIPTTKNASMHRLLTRQLETVRRAQSGYSDSLQAAQVIEESILDVAECRAALAAMPLEIGDHVYSGTRSGRVLTTDRNGLEPGWVEVEWTSGEWTTELAASLD